MLLKYENIVYDTENAYRLNDLIDDILNDLSNSDIVQLWNEYCDKNDYMEEFIFSMNELEDYLETFEKTAYDVITGNVIDPDCFCYQEDWFIESIWGLKSSDSPWDLVDFDDPAFRGFFEDILLDYPEKYDCEEVDEEDEEDSKE